MFRPSGAVPMVSTSAPWWRNTSGAIALAEPAVDALETGLPGSAYTIQWMDTDIDTNATIDLYNDTDDSGFDGMAIVTGIAEDPDGAGDDEYG